jgi:hypothetical protein
MKRLATRLLRGALRRSVSRLLPVGVRDALRVRRRCVTLQRDDMRHPT